MDSYNHLNALIIVLILGIAGLGALFYFEFYPALKPVITEAPKEMKNVEVDTNKEKTTTSSNENNEKKQKEKNTTTTSKVNENTDKGGVNRTNIPLSVPENFEIEVLTNKVPEARDIERGPKGDLWVTRTDAGAISMIDIDNRELDDVKDIFTDMNDPHGIAFDPDNKFRLFIAEEDKISEVTIYSEKSSMEKIADLPEGGRHYTRSLEFGPEGDLFVSIGSTCDVCKEENPKHGTIQKVNLETGELTPYATGLRNAVFIGYNDYNNKMWATEMGRDHLGDDLPPDEINVVKEERNYGWPICYGGNTYDDKFDGAPKEESPCDDKEPSYIDLQAHVAPLGFDFVPASAWSDKYNYDMLVAYHGSWNRTIPVGYKIKRIKLNDQGQLKRRSDFITGWLADDNSSYGRPVDVEIYKDGTAYITDDKSGVVYRVTYQGNSKNNPTTTKR